jgi:glycerophosphoryl diester phosphodiesterase
MLVIVFLVAASCRPPEKTSAPSSLEKQSNKILLIGHRGAAGLAPENTLAAFQRACEIGVDAVELDVFLTADSKIVEAGNRTHIRR